MVHPMMGAAFLGGNLVGMASRHVGTLNVLSLGTGVLTGVWVAQNHPAWVPDLKEELRRFARSATEDDDDATHVPPPLTAGLDEEVVGESVRKAVADLRQSKRSMEKADGRVQTLFAENERSRQQLGDARAALDELKDDVHILRKEAADTIVARMVELKRERRDKGADRERIEYLLAQLRDLRANETGL